MPRPSAAVVPSLVGYTTDLCPTDPSGYLHIASHACTRFGVSGPGARSSLICCRENLECAVTFLAGDEREGREHVFELRRGQTIEIGNPGVQYREQLRIGSP